MRYKLILYILCWPSLIDAAINECAIQQDHCNIIDALLRIDKIERSLFEQGPYVWSVRTPVGGKKYPGAP